MKNITRSITTFLHDEHGAETVEWIVIAAVVVAIGTTAYKTALVTSITNAFNKIASVLTGV